MQGKAFVVNNCMTCPNCVTKRTEGAGYAFDYLCKAAPKKDRNGGLNVIAFYVEYQSEQPKNLEFPEFCPLKSV